VKYPCFRLSQGRTALANHKDSAGTSFNSISPELRTAEGSLDTADLDRILRDVAQEASLARCEALKASGLTRDQVEGTVGSKLYPHLLSLPPQALSDPDFWRYVAVEILREFVFWRDGVNCSLASFGLASARRIPDCVPLRMFNRAHIAHRATDGDPLRAGLLASSAGADFWQSHILRVQSRYDPRVARELAEKMDDGSLPDVQALRQIAKEIRRLRANLVLELQPGDILRDTLNGLTRDTGAGS